MCSTIITAKLELHLKASSQRVDSPLQELLMFFFHVQCMYLGCVSHHHSLRNRQTAAEKRKEEKRRDHGESNLGGRGGLASRTCCHIVWSDSCCIHTGSYSCFHFSMNKGDNHALTIPTNVGPLSSSCGSRPVNQRSLSEMRLRELKTWEEHAASMQMLLEITTVWGWNDCTVVGWFLITFF